jgi:hypothetical protein
MKIVCTRLFGILGIVAIIAILSCVLAGTSEIVEQSSYIIFWFLGPICLVSFIAGLACIFIGRKKFGVWLIITPAIVATVFYSFVLIVCAN